MDREWTMRLLYLSDNYMSPGLLGNMFQRYRVLQNHHFPRDPSLHLFAVHLIQRCNEYSG